MSVDWREPFEKALDADPARAALRHDYADHLEEAGDPDAEALRWLAERGRWPLPPVGNRVGWKGFWNWFETGFAKVVQYHVPEATPAAELPDRLFKQLTRLNQFQGCYRSRREAEADFCRVFREARAAGWDSASE